MKNINKAGNKISNWSEYNEGLKKRGSITFWFNEEEIVNNWQPKEKREKGKGRQKIYSDYVIELMHVISELYKLPYRQTEGFLNSMLLYKNIKQQSPHYTMMTIRSKDLANRITKIKSQIKKLKENGDVINVIIDSTGIKIAGEHEWKVRQYGKEKRRKWDKFHVAIDRETRQVLHCIATNNNIHDGQVFERILTTILDEKIPIDKLYGDGAYHQHSIIEQLAKNAIEPMIPLPKNAVVSNENRETIIKITKARDKLLLKQHDAGGVDQWKKVTDYHYRSLIENFFSRLKTIFGERVRQKDKNIRRLRLKIRASILNKFATLGLPRYG